MIEVLKKIFLALVFGAIYFLLTALIPFGYRFSELVCGDFEDAFQFGNGHFTLAFCGALTFFMTALMKRVGWSGFIKTMAVSYLCFQIYSIQQIHDFIFVQKCYYPLPFSQIPPSSLLRYFSAGLIIIIYWTGICVSLLVIYQRMLPIFTDLRPTEFKRND